MKNKIIKIITAIIIITILMITIFDVLIKDEDIKIVPLHLISSLSLPEEAQTLTLSKGWNLISLPDNATKAEMIIVYNNSCHLWDIAVTKGIILNFIYDYKEINGYRFSNEFIIGRGYWVYSYYDDVFFINGNIRYCGFINFDNDSAYVIRCKKLVVSPTEFSNEITCNGLDVDEMIFRVLDVNETVQQR